MKISCVTVCVDYEDFLSFTLPKNLPLLDSIHVVTELNRVQKLTAVPYISDKKVTVVGANGIQNDAGFNKGFGIDLALRTCDLNNWVLLLDADVVLPGDFASKLGTLDREYFYGCRRRNFEKLEDFLDVEKGLKQVSDFHLFRGVGYGYFQLFHPKSSTFKHLLNVTKGHPFPTCYQTGACSDWIFRNCWGNFHFVPSLEVVCFGDSQDYCDGLLRELPMEVAHLGLTGRNEFKRLTPRIDKILSENSTER